MTPLTITSLDQGRALGQRHWRTLTEKATETPDPQPAQPRAAWPRLLAWLLHRPATA